MHWLSHMVHGIMVGDRALRGRRCSLIVIFRFNSRRNPTPARFTHNTRIEIAWTLVPVVILIVIGSFSLPILFKQLEVPTPDLTVKATGNQWYWTLRLPGERRHLRQPDAAPRTISRRTAIRRRLHLLATDTARGGAGRQGGAHAGDRRRRDPRLDDPGLRREDRRGARAAERDLVPGRGGGHLLRPVLGALRQEPQLHADHRQGGEPGGLRRLAELGDRRVRRHPARGAAPAGGRRPPAGGSRRRRGRPRPTAPRRAEAPAAEAPAADAEAPRRPRRRAAEAPAAEPPPAEPRRRSPRRAGRRSAPPAN